MRYFALIISFFSFSVYAQQPDTIDAPYILFDDIGKYVIRCHTPDNKIEDYDTCNFTVYQLNVDNPIDSISIPCDEDLPISIDSCPSELIEKYHCKNRGTAWLAYGKSKVHYTTSEVSRHDSLYSDPKRFVSHSNHELIIYFDKKEIFRDTIAHHEIYHGKETIQYCNKNLIGLVHGIYWKHPSLDVYFIQLNYVSEYDYQIEYNLAFNSISESKTTKKLIRLIK